MYSSMYSSNLIRAFNRKHLLDSSHRRPFAALATPCNVSRHTETRGDLRPVLPSAVTGPERKEVEGGLLVPSHPWMSSWKRNKRAWWAGRKGKVGARTGRRLVRGKLHTSDERNVRAAIRELCSSGRYFDVFSRRLETNALGRERQSVRGERGRESGKGVASRAGIIHGNLKCN